MIVYLFSDGNMSAHCDICNLHVKVHQNKLQAKNIFLSHNPSAQYSEQLAI